MRRTANGRAVPPLPGAPIKPEATAPATTPQITARQLRKINRANRMIPVGVGFRLQ